MHYKINRTQFRLDKSIIYVNENTVNCSNNVAQALDLFLNSKNQVITKEMIMTAIWGDIIVSDDSLFKIVQGVRKILKKANLNGALVNVYGKGYKIEPEIIVLENKINQTTEQNKTNQPKPSSKKPIIKIAMTLIALITLILIIYYTINHYKNSPIINENRYEELKEMGSSDATQLLELLNKQYSSQDLKNEDIIKIAYLKGFGHYKQGEYKSSIAQLLNAIKQSKSNNSHIATADTYLLLANIYVYQSKYKEMWQYLNQAEGIYTSLTNDKGLSKVSLSRGRYFMAIDDFDKSFEEFANLMDKSKNNKDIKTQIEVLYNTSYLHKLLDNFNQAKLELTQMLELSLQIGDGENLAKSYSSLSSINKLQGNFIDAMKQAQATIRYAIDQNDTNRFQQSFSSLYNILNELGHQQLAEHYLNAAIDFQHSRNSDGRLTIAELNLGILNLQTKNYNKAQRIFDNLLAYQKPSSAHLETQAWLALTRHFQKDNINAYSLSHEVYSHKNINNRSKLVAGIALALSTFELERFNDAETIFKQLEKIDRSKWLIENSYFNHMAIALFTDRDDIKYNKFSLAKDDHNQRLQILRQKTKPEDSFLKALDNYIATIFRP